MPADVNVRVDQPGQERQSSQVVGGGARRRGVDAIDRRSANHDRHVACLAALAVEERSCANDDSILRVHGDRSDEQRGGKQRSNHERHYSDG
jgi:hypothetical protein